MALHRDLTGADLHEPKGVSGAANKTTYVADGAGSGAWAKPEAAHVTILDTAGNFVGTDVETALAELYAGFGIIDGEFADVSTGSTVLLPIPFSCEVVSIDMVLAGSITTADSTVTVTRSDGAAMGTQVIAFSGSAEGSAVTFTPTGNNQLTYPTHRYVKLVTDGNSSTAQRLFLQMHIERI